jgi:hypothetical protein
MEVVCVAKQRGTTQCRSLKIFHQVNLHTIQALVDLSIQIIGTAIVLTKALVSHFVCKMVSSKLLKGMC